MLFQLHLQESKHRLRWHTPPIADDTSPERKRPIGAVALLVDAQDDIREPSLAKSLELFRQVFGCPKPNDLEPSLQPRDAPMADPEVREEKVASDGNGFWLAYQIAVVREAKELTREALLDLAVELGRGVSGDDRIS
jgi:hypothetical protein